MKSSAQSAARLFAKGQLGEARKLAMAARKGEGSAADGDHVLARVEAQFVGRGLLLRAKQS